MRRLSLILALMSLTLIHCGGATGGDSQSPGGGPEGIFGTSSVGPIVDSTSVPGETTPGSITGADWMCATPQQSVQMSLRVTGIDHAHNTIFRNSPHRDAFADLVPQNAFDNVMVIRTGSTHQYGYPEPEELQTRIHLRMDYLGGGTAMSRGFAIKFVDVLEFSTNILAGLQTEPKLTIGTSHGLRLEGDSQDQWHLPATFDDDIAPGIFDFVQSAADRDWNGKFLMGQVCDAELSVDGELKMASSPPIFLIILPGFDVEAAPVPQSND